MLATYDYHYIVETQDTSLECCITYSSTTLDDFPESWSIYTSTFEAKPTISQATIIPAIATPKTATSKSHYAGFKREIDYDGY